jgi:hypothetical protein
MIDINSEEVFPLRDATEIVPSNRRDKEGKPKPVSFQCILRWVEEGSIGPDGERVKLEAIRLGNRWLTSREALQRFAERLTPAPQTPATKRTVKQARTRCERAAQELERQGV